RAGDGVLAFAHIVHLAAAHFAVVALVVEADLHGAAAVVVVDLIDAVAAEDGVIAVAVADVVVARPAEHRMPDRRKDGVEKIIAGAADERVGGVLGRVFDVVIGGGIADIIVA